ncbi:YtxH domain-containing protein [Facklamia miroungae]|uniref:Gas vesicle protein n=1 Tax=Facklamia miroungae TaxID=120956 RepID=A0A1G7QUT6_9LACT|nr:YtxH domain-containing protein [Facklamia miroungae]NKZ29074.1 YtxH domain-containing protein [Facklamia miroungae]SDG02286.1 Gas vesicle protein [Facklamia miroungae]
MKNFPQGFITGLALGVLAGLMNARQSGEKTRYQLKQAYNDLQVDLDQMDQDYERFNNSIKTLNYESKQTIKFLSHLITQTKNKFEDETQPRMRRIKGNLNQLNKDLETVTQLKQVKKN